MCPKGYTFVNVNAKDDKLVDCVDEKNKPATFNIPKSVPTPTPTSAPTTTPPS
jgi:hypothetical protein